MAFYYRGMKRMFINEGVVTPPYIVTGNKMRFSAKSFEFIEGQLGRQRADWWLDEFFYLVRLTHWILPYPLNKSLIMSTKESRSQGLWGRIMWFLAVFVDPSLVRLLFEGPPRTVYTLVYYAHRQSGRMGAHDQAWETAALIKVCRQLGLRMQGVDRTVEHWIAGRMSAGTKGFLPIWERGMPPTLAMRERIRGLSLDELDRLMVAFTQEGGAAVAEGGQREEIPV
ncbi:hypothetical protein DPSP01_014256 [Paraphaeosphaeria sporulosa]